MVNFFVVIVFNVLMFKKNIPFTKLGGKVIFLSFSAKYFLKTDLPVISNISILQKN